MVARGRGYWITPTLDVVEVDDHQRYLNDLDRDAQFFPEKLSVKDREQAAGLPEPGWTKPQPDERKKPGEHRERVLVEAMKRKWVRARRQGPLLVIEFWRRSEDMIAGIALGLRQIGIPDGETVELHDIESGRPQEVRAGDLYAQLRPEFVGEPSAVGFSVYDNPARGGVRKVPGKGVYVSEVTGNPRSYRGRNWIRPYSFAGGASVYANPAEAVSARGLINLPNGGVFEYEATGEPERIGKPRENPVVGSVFGRPTYARLSVGFNTNRTFRRVTGLPVGDPVSVEHVKVAMEGANNVPKTGRPAGYTIVSQVGRYAPEPKKGEEPKVIDEPGVQIILFPESVETSDDYFSRINHVGIGLVTMLDQEQVFYELAVNGVLVSSGMWSYEKEADPGAGAFVDFRLEAEKLGALRIPPEPGT